MTQLDPSIILRAGAVQPLQPADILERRAQLQMRNIETQRQQRQDQLAEQQMAVATKHQQTLADVGKQFAAGDMTGAQSTAAQAGDFDLVSKLRTMDDGARDRAFKISQNTAPLLLSLKNVPPEQRAQAFRQMAPELQARGFTPEHIDQLAQQGLTDQALDQIGASAQTIAEYQKQANDDRNFGLEKGKAAETGRHNQATEGQAAATLRETVRDHNMTAANARARLAQETATGGPLSSDAIDLAAQLYRSTGTMPPLGMGRSAANSRALVMNRAAQLSGTPGNPFDAASAANDIRGNIVAFGGQKAAARTVGTIGGKVDYGVNELTASIPLAQKSSQALPRGSFVPLTKVEQMIQSGTSDPRLKDFAVKTKAVINAYNLVAGRAGTGVAEREYNSNLLRTADSPAAYNAALAAMNMEGQVTQAASRRTMNDIAGKKSPPTGVPADIAKILAKHGH